MAKTRAWGEEKEKPAMRWGDVDEDEDGDMEEPLEREEKTFSTQPDENGIKIVTTFRTNEDGRKVKITRKVKVTTKTVRINKNVARRRKWAKFGRCAEVGPGPEPNVTYVSPDTIPLNLKPRKREEEEPTQEFQSKLEKLDKVVVCRHCQGTDHYSMKCPKRKDIEVQGVPSANVGRGGGRGGPGLQQAGGKYVPIHLREGGRGRGRGGGMMMGRDDSATIRVTNISEDTNEDDLRDLFRPYGRTTRIYLAKDKFTHKSRGFAFISYTTRAEAQRAILALNDKGYDNLILHVEFAQPREREDLGPAPQPGQPGSAEPQGPTRDRRVQSSLAYDQVGAGGKKFDTFDDRAF
jgi:translation initiation factor 3 subunit G